ASTAPRPALGRASERELRPICGAVCNRRTYNPRRSHRISDPVRAKPPRPVVRGARWVGSSALGAPSSDLLVLGLDRLLAVGGRACALIGGAVRGAVAVR